MFLRDQDGRSADADRVHAECDEIVDEQRIDDAIENVDDDLQRHIVGDAQSGVRLLGNAALRERRNSGNGNSQHRQCRNHCAFHIDGPFFYRAPHCASAHAPEDW